jgi:hypothetical protein
MRRLFAVALLASLAVGGGVATADVGPFADPPPVRVTDDTSGGVLWPFLNDSATTRTTVHVGHPSDGRPAPVGADPEPVGFVLVNDDRGRSVQLQVVHEPTNATVFDRQATMADGTATTLVFHEPATHRVIIRANGQTSEYPVERDDFDCNEKTIGVRTEAEGQTAYTSVSTSMGCPSLLGEPFEDALAVGPAKVFE